MVTREKLVPGALIETNFTDEEIVIKNGRRQYDSYVDCAGIIPCSTEKLLSGEYFGELNDNDRKCIWDILETTDTLTTKQKKRFGIKRR